MATYVMVGGAWIGAWAWQRVARGLRANGHEVYPLSLTGLGERAHLARPDVDLETHIADVINLLEYEGLDDVMLVGHSYAAFVITGVADRAGDRLGALVYLDSARYRTACACWISFRPRQRSSSSAKLTRSATAGGCPSPASSSSLSRPTWTVLATRSAS